MKKHCLYIFHILSIAIAYFLAAKLGQLLAIPPGYITAVWPPAGIALISILWFGYGVWPGIWLGSFISNTISFFSPDSAIVILTVAVFIGLGSSLEAIVGAFFLKKLAGSVSLEKVYNVFIFLIFSAIISCSINPTIGTTSLLAAGMLSPENYWLTWVTWWLGDAAGVITVVPTILSCSFFPWHLLEKRKLLESFLLLIITFISSWLIFTYYDMLAFLLIPLIVWSVFRCGPQVSTLLCLMISLVAMVHVIEGHLLFGSMSVNTSMLVFQSFLAVIFSIVLFLSALSSEREEAYVELYEANADLEAKVLERTADLNQTLINLKNTQSQLLQSEKMSSLGVLTAGMAHEINNPINFVLSSIHPLKQNISDFVEILSKYSEINSENSAKKLLEIKELQKNLNLDYSMTETSNLLNGIQGGATRIADIIKTLRIFSHIDETAMKKVDIEEGIDATLTLLQHRYGERIKIVKEYGHVPPIDCYPANLNQYFITILTNSIDSIKDTGQIVIKTEQINQDVRISIKDTGVGIAQENLKKIFEPFFTTKGVGSGIGLGLSIAYSAIQELNRTIEVKSTLGEGSEFIIQLPINQESIVRFI